MLTTTKTLAEDFAEHLQADEDESLDCSECGAKGLSDCIVGRHVATTASFAAMNSRTHRVWAAKIARGE